MSGHSDEISDIRAANVLYKSLVVNLRRKLQFERNWLKRNHPETYQDMQDASQRNDEDYMDAQMKKFNNGLSDMMR
jgi:hypothetical protein